jgi:excisionase family DNA binding protein
VSDAADDIADATPSDRWASTADAADYLGLTTRTVYRFINDGELPAYKMGRVIRILRSDLDAFIASRRIAPGTLEHLVPPLKEMDEA